MLYKIVYIDSYVKSFFANFDPHYADGVATDFNSLSLPEQVAYVKHLYEVINYMKNLSPRSEASEY